jgi:hypothetical protein
MSIHTNVIDFFCSRFQVWGGEKKVFVGFLFRINMAACLQIHAKIHENFENVFKSKIL